jgi:predicted SAM-dependent methyltransferase
VEYGDIVKGLPVAADSCESVYCSHVLEHLCLADCRTALRNVYRILSPGGIFRLVLPDLRFCIEEYAASSSQDAALTFLRRSGLGQEQPARGLRQFLVLWLGNSSHLWLWDYESMAAELTDAGFCDIRRAAFHDSQESCFADVEDQERWQDCLGIECRRPCVA